MQRNYFLSLLLIFVMALTAITACDPNNGGPSENEDMNKRNPNIDEISEIHPYADIENAFPEIVFDNADTIRNTAREFKGVGFTINEETALMLRTHKQADPERYNYILNLLFSRESGVGLNHIIWESNASEILADLLSVNPDITVEVNLNNIAESELLSSAINISFVSSNSPDALITLKDELNIPDIKTIGIDVDGSLSEAMLNDINLLNAVDIIGIEAGTYNESLIQLNERYNKEIWCYLNISDQTDVSPEKPNLNLAYSIAAGINQNNAVKFIISDPFPSLMDLSNPDEGYIGIGSPLWQVANINLLLNKGYLPVIPTGNEKPSEKEKGFDYFAMTNPITGDYTIVVANNTPKANKLTFTAKGFDKEDDVLYVWETTGAQYEGQDYYENFFQNSDSFYPVEFGLHKYADQMALFENAYMEENEETPNTTVPYSFSFQFKPYSVTAISTNKLGNKTVYPWEVYSDIVLNH